MPIDDSITEDQGNSTESIVVRDPGHCYTHSEVCDILVAAEKLGFSLAKGSELDNMQLRDIAALVKYRH